MRDFLGSFLSIGIFLGMALSPAAAMDPSFVLLQESDSVRVYYKKQADCITRGVTVLFVVENKTSESLDVELHTTQLRRQSTFKLRLDPLGKTSVISLGSGVEMCNVQVVDLTLTKVGA